MLFAAVSRPSVECIYKIKSMLEICGLDTPLEEHSGLHLDKLDAALDHRDMKIIKSLYGLDVYS